MITLKKLTQYLDNLLEIEEIPDDISNNGLQIEGSQKVNKIIFGVDACLAIAKIAAKKNADFIFVHHGLSWGNGFKRIIGNSARIFSTFFKNNVSLYGAHLPLDAHPELGHNAQISKRISLKNCEPFAEYAKAEIGIMGKLEEPITLATLAKIVDQKLGTKPVIYGDKNKSILKIGIISGGPGSFGIDAAEEKGLDCLITGEVNHTYWHLIQETGMNVIAAGHYCTEKPGVLAVMEKVKTKFNIDCEFIELPTGL
jgi:dinuclear metal center YbgI/SA1388 family protein